MLSGLISAEGVVGDDFVKSVRVVAVLPGLHRVCVGGEEAGGSMEGPGEAGVSVAHKGRWLRLALGRRRTSGDKTLATAYMTMWQNLQGRAKSVYCDLESVFMDLTEHSS